MKKTILPENTVRLVEQHRIYPTDPRYEVIDTASFASKNIYNLTNYQPVEKVGSKPPIDEPAC